MRLTPHRSVSLAWLGLALLETGDRVGAKEALARSVQVDPKYQWAIGKLFELRLADKEEAAAAELLGAIDRHFAPAERHRRRIEFALARSDRPAALSEFESLLRFDDAPQVEAVAAALSARYPNQVGPLVSDRLPDPQGSAAAGLAWATWAERALWRRVADRRLSRAAAATAMCHVLRLVHCAVKIWLEIRFTRIIPRLKRFASDLLGAYILPGPRGRGQLRVV